MPHSPPTSGSLGAFIAQVRVPMNVIIVIAMCIFMSSCCRQSKVVVSDLPIEQAREQLKKYSEENYGARLLNVDTLTYFTNHCMFCGRVYRRLSLSTHVATSTTLTMRSTKRVYLLIPILHKYEDSDYGLESFIKYHLVVNKKEE